MKRLSRAQRRIDTKLLYDQYGFEKTKFDRRYQDTHNCPVCSEPKEDRNHMFTCKAPTARTNRKKSLTGLTKVLEDLDTSQTLTKMITGSLRHVHNGTTPYAQSFGYATLVGASQLEISLKIRLIQDRPTFYVKDRVRNEKKSTEKTLSMNEQEKISLSLSHYYT